MAEEEPLEALLRAANRGDARAYAAFLRAITPIVRGVARGRGAGLGQDMIELEREMEHLHELESSIGY